MLSRSSMLSSIETSGVLLRVRHLAAHNPALFACFAPLRSCLQAPSAAAEPDGLRVCTPVQVTIDEGARLLQPLVPALVLSSLQVLFCGSGHKTPSTDTVCPQAAAQTRLCS